MAYNVREMLNEFSGGLKNLGNTNPKSLESFMGLLGTTYESNVIDLKTKELMSVAIGLYIRCEYCVVYHSYKSFEAGATPEEIREAGMLAVAFGGGPSMSYAVTLLNDCINEFKGDF